MVANSIVIVIENINAYDIGTVEMEIERIIISFMTKKETNKVIDIKQINRKGKNSISVLYFM